MSATRGTALSSGFTLIELLIVVVILSTLAAIVVPSFVGTRKPTNDAVHAASINGVRDAIERYVLDHGEYPSQVELANIPLCTDGSLLLSSINNKALVFANQLLMYSNQSGEICDDRKNNAYPFGPYLKNLPVNLHCDNQGVGIAYDETLNVPERENRGWGYLPLTGEFALSGNCV